MFKAILSTFFYVNRSIYHLYVIVAYMPSWVYQDLPLPPSRMCHFWLGYTGHDDVREIFLGIFWGNKKGLFVKFSWEFFGAKKKTLVTNFFVGEN